MQLIKIKGKNGLDCSVAAVLKFVNLDLFHSDLFLLQVKEVHLNRLYLSKNQLQTLPEGFEHLQCLTHLDLSHNQFQELPPSIGLLRFLEVLNISQNDIGIVPEDICRLSEYKTSA